MPPLPEIATVLATNFALCLAGFTVLWLIGSAIKDVTFIDAVWALGLAGLALATYLQADGYGPRKMLLAALALAWGLRLGLYLLWRWTSHGPDRRYVRMMEKAKSERGWSYRYASLRLVFALQSPLLWIVSLPVQLGQLSTEPARITALGWLGAGLAIFGIAFETLADAQLVGFKRDPANQGKV